MASKQKAIGKKDTKKGQKGGKEKGRKQRERKEQKYEKEKKEESPAMAGNNSSCGKRKLLKRGNKPFSCSMKPFFGRCFDEEKKALSRSNQLCKV